jgi:hypothetical protein
MLDKGIERSHLTYAGSKRRFYRSALVDPHDAARFKVDRHPSGIAPSIPHPPPTIRHGLPIRRLQVPRHRPPQCFFIGYWLLES